MYQSEENTEEKIPKRILKLDEAVINRIAAGEVIQRPANALKELLENSLDAGASIIQVVVKNGGLKLLQIQDDGVGISREDLPIVCERFTTSKLEKFEDLQTICTYGFRGEALASISHVAHLTILTKTVNSQCAFRAEYSDGKLKEHLDGMSASHHQNPKPCAGNQGTTIIVEDLFYNMDTRKRAMKSSTEEYNKIVEIVTKYSIHNSEVGFSLKKHGEQLTDVRTPSQSSAVDNIKFLYGVAIARELIPVFCNDASYQFKMDGYISNVNYSVKKPSYLLFINNRLVDSTAIRKAVGAIYASYLPKGTHPFVYMSLNIDPRNVDVNVHPTKHEVHFLHEDLIITAITNSIENTLLGSSESRIFRMQNQALLPGGPINSTLGVTSKKRRDDNSNDPFSSRPTSASSSQQNMVRTDPKLQKLDKFLTSTPNTSSAAVPFQDSPSVIQIISDDTNNQVNVNNQPAHQTASQTSQGSQPRKREIRLKSIRQLKEKIQTDNHPSLYQVFRNHTFVGAISRSLALIQHDTKLYMTNVCRLSCELFYQKLLYNFGNFGRISIDDPIYIRELVQMALELPNCEWTEEWGPKENIAEQAHLLLLDKSKMLDDYFQLSFDSNGRLLTIPILLENYFPMMEGLPNYILNLWRKVDWTQELACFESFAHQTAIFYSIPPGYEEQNEEITLNKHSWRWTVEHVLFPELKKAFPPPKTFAEDTTVVLLANLPDLYKVFERC